jgi:iron-sulfur cluster assembly protein
MSTSNQILEVTDLASTKVQELLSSRGKPSVGIRVGVKQGGCSGLSYYIEYADEVDKYDEVVEGRGVKILIQPKAVMYLLGTTMDYMDTKIKSGFVFKNPNEKGKCGCGESFHV